MAADRFCQWYSVWLDFGLIQLIIRHTIYGLDVFATQTVETEKYSTIGSMYKM